MGLIEFLFGRKSKGAGTHSEGRHKIKKDKNGNEVCPQCGRSEKYLTAVRLENGGILYLCSECVKKLGGNQLRLG